MHRDFLFVGTYTDESGSEGIYNFALDEKTGLPEKRQSFGRCSNPSFLVTRGDRLYAVNELPDKGLVTACAVGQDGALQYINELATPGNGMCHLSIHPGGQLAFAANFGSGDVVACGIGEDGALIEVLDHVVHNGSGPVPRWQEQPHLHSTTPSADGRYLVAADLGSDRLTVYEPDGKTGKLRLNEKCTGVQVAPGSGPRHFAFHPGGRYAYLVNEISNALDVFAYEAADGVLVLKDTLPLLPEGFAGYSHAADIHLSPDAAFVYASNRGCDGITVFRIEQEGAALRRAGFYPTGGKEPRNFCISPDGALLIAANQNSNNVVAFARDAQSGALGQKCWELDVPKPVCVVWHTIKD